MPPSMRPPSDKLISFAEWREIQRQEIQAGFAQARADNIALKELVEARMTSIILAQDKFETFVNAKFISTNEVRAQLGTQRAEFIPRSECLEKHKAVEGKLDTLQTSISALQKFMWGAIGAIAVLEVILRFVK